MLSSVNDHWCRKERMGLRAYQLQQPGAVSEQVLGELFLLHATGTETQRTIGWAEPNYTGQQWN